jgi:HTH-type transcriptional regulator/antitoxin HigA
MARSDNCRAILPARIIPPGVTIAAELRARGWTQHDLAALMHRPVRTIRELIQGEREITERDARWLADVFGTSVEFWVNLEANYREHLAQRGERDGG